MANLSTIIVLRNDRSTNWANSDIVLREGELGVSYLDNGNVIVKAGNGRDTWNDLSQVESVLEDDMKLTFSFGKYTAPAGGFVNAGGAGMTVSQWITDALKRTDEPTRNAPSASFTSATAVVENSDPEIGAKIIGAKWVGSVDVGSYSVGSATQASGLAEDDFSWTVSCDADPNCSSNLQSSTNTDYFTFANNKKITITSESSTSYATVSATVTLTDVSGVNTPTNNIGDTRANAKFTVANSGSPWTPTKDIYVTGYRKAFWGALNSTERLATTINSASDNTLTSDFIRGLADLTNADGSKRGGASSYSTNGAKGLPSVFTAPAGTDMVIFAAKADAYKGKTLTVKDGRAQDATVTFTKVAKAVRVKGANDYVTSTETAAKDGELYDIWYADWNDKLLTTSTGIAVPSELKLSWS